MNILKIKKASSIRDEVPDFQIVSDGVIRDSLGTNSGEGNWLKEDVANGKREGSALAEFLVKHLPGRTVDGLLIALMERQATALRVHHDWLDALADKASGAAFK